MRHSRLDDRHDTVWAARVAPLVAAISDRPVRIRATADALTVTLAYGLATLMHHDLHPEGVAGPELLGFLVAATAVQLFASLGVRAWVGEVRPGTSAEIGAAAAAAFVGLPVLVALDTDLGRPVPASALFTGAALGVVLLMVTRWAGRLEGNPHLLLRGAPGHAREPAPVAYTDLLGRREIRTDVESIASYLAGRRVLVTGAGGSIGSELCRQLARFAPERLIMLDRDESALHTVQLQLEGRALLSDRNVVVADIRDEGRIEELFAEHAPDVVFHAAALKHLPLLEMYPSEAVKTNVLGTKHVLDAALRHGVRHFVNISTDKAVDPTSVLGWTKRIGERLTAAAAAAGSGVYLSVRFGNVLGSRGSVLTAFEAQIDRGGPLTVTHPDVTRYFMTVSEAVRLVVQAGAIGRGGEALVLDMGEPVRITAVARRLAARAPRPVEIVFTGLRPGEKLHEALFGRGERDERPIHPMISHVPVPPLAESDRARLDHPLPREELLRALREVGVAPTASIPGACIPGAPIPGGPIPGAPLPAELEAAG